MQIHPSTNYALSQKYVLISSYFKYVIISSYALSLKNVII